LATATGGTEIFSVWCGQLTSIMSRSRFAAASRYETLHRVRIELLPAVGGKDLEMLKLTAIDALSPPLTLLAFFCRRLVLQIERDEHPKPEDDARLLVCSLPLRCSPNAPHGVWVGFLFLSLCLVTQVPCHTRLIPVSEPGGSAWWRTQELWVGCVHRARGHDDVLNVAKRAKDSRRSTATPCTLTSRGGSTSNGMRC